MPDADLEKTRLLTESEVAALLAPTASAAVSPGAATSGFRLRESPVVRLDRPAVVGRRPSPPRIVTGAAPRMVRVLSPGGEVSSSHVELRQVGSAVIVTDLRSTNGTVVTMPGGQPRTLRQGESVVVSPGTLVDIGDDNVLEILPAARAAVIVRKAVVTEIGDSTTQHSVVIPGRDDGPIRLAWAAATDVGKRRAANEDSFVIRPPLFAVADGMGGHSAGDLASAAVVERLAELASDDFVTATEIESALVTATEDIETIEGDLGVGTTVTGAALTLQNDNPYFAVFNIGDSRVYRFERNELTQVTVDHSVVQELVDAGALSREEAEHHPDSNIITRAVGFNAQPLPDYWMLPMRTGLRLLICSDGLTKEVGDDRIRLHLAAGLSPAETADALVDAALAAGGRDNVTTVIVDVLEAPDFVQQDTAEILGATDHGIERDIEDTEPGRTR